MKLTTEQYTEYSDDYMGYCSGCDDLTTENVEPDGEEYICERCHHETVMGLENALLMEHVEISDEESDEDDLDEDDEDS